MVSNLSDSPASASKDYKHVPTFLGSWFIFLKGHSYFNYTVLKILILSPFEVMKMVQLYCRKKKSHLKPMT